jgi:hypothetical protein
MTNALVNHELRASPLSGSPPPRHPAPMEFRCKDFKRGIRDLDGNRIRCGNWCKRGHDRCAFHLRFFCRPKAAHHLRGGTNNDRIPTLPVAYSKYLSESLNERLKSLEQGTPVELLDMTEELKLAKTTIHDAAQFYDAALMAGDIAVDDKAKLAALQASLAAGQLMRDVIAQVGDIAEQAATVMGQAKEFYSVQNIPLMISQIITAIRDEIGDDTPEKVMRIAERIREIRMPSAGPQGTDITPDMDAQAMDATVPTAPDIVPRIASEQQHEENAA